MRAEFPVLERFAYLNAGTMGPAPRRAIEAAAAWLERDLADGRSSQARFDWAGGEAARLRARLAGLLGCDASELALTRSTTDGVNAALMALDLGPGDEVVTSDEEHPGLMGPLQAGARRRGYGVRIVPFDRVAESVSGATTLVAVSHISWITGRAVDAEALARSGVRVLLDGAQGIGAVHVDVRELGCDFYAASGQKWLCGPEGSGCLYVRGGGAGTQPPWAGYSSLKDPARAEHADWHDDARRFDTVFPPAQSLAWAHAALDVLEEAGWHHVYERAAALARHLAAALAARGAEPIAGDSPLVAWRAGDADALVARLHEHGIVVRALPGRDLVRASVGAWSREDELERLADLASGA